MTWRDAPVVLSAGAPCPGDVVRVVVIGGHPQSGPERALYPYTGLENGFRCNPLVVLLAVARPLDRFRRGLHPLLVATPAVLTDDFRRATARVVLLVPLRGGGDHA